MGRNTSHRTRKEEAQVINSCEGETVQTLQSSKIAEGLKSRVSQVSASANVHKVAKNWSYHHRVRASC